MKSEQGFFQNNFSSLGFQIISIFDWILGLYVRERFVSINGVYNCSSKFDVPAHFGNGNHSFWLLSKIHYPQLIAFDFSNYISFLDVALFLKSWKCKEVRQILKLQVNGLSLFRHKSLREHRNFSLFFPLFQCGRKQTCLFYMQC